jgi:nicotinate-nucleotide adenylyltransferase
MPASVPPHKTRKKITNPDLRLKMINLAIDGYSYFHVSDYEISKGGLSYTRDTVRYLRKSNEWKNDTLYWILGSDNLVELNTWKEPETILQEIQVLLMPRIDFDIKSAESRFLSKMNIVKTPLIEISSTEIRHRVKEGKSIQFWVPECVEEYIHNKGLYL